MSSFLYGSKMYARQICFLALTPFLERATAIRFGTRRAVDDYTAPSPVASLPDTSIPLARKRVRVFLFITTHSPYTIANVSTGWTPSTFVSSRSDRAKQKATRPEDYMDEEDLAELRESQIMSGVKEQQQRDVFADTAQAEPPQGEDPEQE